ncbi:MAG TPA: hypothetical protein PKN52_00130 [Trueperaceae bacterium]|nr:hypothetical protein [Trueperaceae bacterium]
MSIELVIVYLTLGILIAELCSWNERRSGREPGAGAYMWLSLVWPAVLAMALVAIAARPQAEEDEE